MFKMYINYCHFTSIGNFMRTCRQTLRLFSRLHSKGVVYLCYLSLFILH